jgi:HK97 family phage portal protein
VAHLALHGNAFLMHVHNGAGAIIGLTPVPPSAVAMERAPRFPGGKLFTLSLGDGTQARFTAVDLLHIPGLSTDGFRGISPISAARNALGTGIAADRAAAGMFQNGFLLGGMVTTEEDVDEEEGRAIKDSLRAKMAGSAHAGDVAFVNRQLKFTPWTTSAEDAQFIESRRFQIAEVARIFGVPKVLLAEDGASTWGSGVAELNRGLARYTLRGYTARIEQRVSTLLAQPMHAEFEYKSLLQGTPSEEVELILSQVAAGLLTRNEGRELLGRDPLPEASSRTSLGTEA